MVSKINKTKIKKKKATWGPFNPFNHTVEGNKLNGLTLNPSNATINYDLSKNNKIMCEENWEELEIITLSKVSQTQENNQIHLLSLQNLG